jgi:hypothetical protein
MPEHPDAAHRIRTKLAAGTLRQANVRRMIVIRGTGRGRRCDACDTTISREDLLGIIECVGNDTPLHMHSGCASIWQYQSSREGQRRSRDGQRPMPAPGRATPVSSARRSGRRR